MSLLTETLGKIRAETRQTDRVVFVFHSWMPIRNIGSEGFKLKSIPTATIARMELLPIVAHKVINIDSRKSRANNKYVPFETTTKVDIESSWIDLMNKHGQYGLVRLDALNCDVDSAERYVEIYNKVMSAFVGGRLQDLPEFFGTESPVITQFETMTRRVTTTAGHKLSALVNSGEVTPTEANKFRQAIKQMARSAEIAHLVALDPAHGILPKSIEEINVGDKARFDATDNFIIREFPDYNASTKLNRQQKGDDIQQLARVIAGAIQQQQQQPQPQAQAVTQQPLEATVANPPHLEVTFGVEDSGLEEPLSLLDDVPELTLPSAITPDYSEQPSVEELTATGSSLKDATEEQAESLCEAMTGTGNRCKNPVFTDYGACQVFAHQKQLRPDLFTDE